MSTLPSNGANNDQSQGNSLQQPPISGLKSVPQYNYFQSPLTAPSSTTQNPLLSNGLPSTFNLPNIAALRPPTNVNLPKLSNFTPLQPPANLNTTNFSQLQPPQKLGTTNFNPLQPPPTLNYQPKQLNTNLLLTPPTLGDNKSITNSQPSSLNNPLLQQNQKPNLNTQPVLQPSQQNAPLLQPQSQASNLLFNSNNEVAASQPLNNLLFNPPVSNQTPVQFNNIESLSNQIEHKEQKIKNIETQQEKNIEENKNIVDDDFKNKSSQEASLEDSNNNSSVNNTSNSSLNQIAATTNTNDSFSSNDQINLENNNNENLNHQQQQPQQYQSESQPQQYQPLSQPLSQPQQYQSESQQKQYQPLSQPLSQPQQYQSESQQKQYQPLSQPQQYQPPPLKNNIFNINNNLPSKPQTPSFQPQTPSFQPISSFANQPPSNNPTPQPQLQQQQLPTFNSATPLLLQPTSLNNQPPTKFSPIPSPQPLSTSTGNQLNSPRFSTVTGPPQPITQQQPQLFAPSPLRPTLQSPLVTPSTLSQPPPFSQPNLTRPQYSGPPVSNLPPQSSSQQFQQQQQPLVNMPPTTQQTPFMQPGLQMGPPPVNTQPGPMSPLVPQPQGGPPLSGSAIRPNAPPLSYKYPTPNTTNQQSLDGPPLQQQNGQFQQSSSSTLPPVTPNQLASQFNNLGIKGQKPLAVDLLHEKRLIPPYDDNTEIIRPKFPHEFYTNVNCHPDIIRSTLTSIPESQSLLSKCRLPLGILIHPFKDLESLKVVQSTTIVRCRNCRSYINPFVHFLDNTKWRCNLCYSTNDLPDEFLFDPVTRSYGDPSKRPEINSSTIEFIAPAEYTLRPPPPAMYLFLLDVSHNAINTGYLQNACEILEECLDKLPGDTRTQIGFITYNSCIQFYNLHDAQMLVYPDIDDVVLPLPENLMINLADNKESIQTFLQDLPNLFSNTNDTESALGTALTAAHKLLSATGGRITVLQTCLPSIGVGALKQRSESIEKDSQALAPQSDFYKKLALECAGVHIAVDLFMFNALYTDLATLSCISKYSGGEIKYYPEFHLEKFPEQSDRFSYDFKRYLTRKIGFEAVMRIRCTRGLSIHTFHGNFFVRSTDLLALPNVNPDAGFGMQISIDETLNDVSTVCFQAALLYTSSKGERRIRIHTYCLPVSSNVGDLINGADQEAIIGLVAKMAVDRSVMNSVKEAKDALANVSIDYLNAYTNIVTKRQKGSLLTPYSLRLLPLYTLALMKNNSFKYGHIKIDDRVYLMNALKSMPLKYLLLLIYPNLYAVHNIDDSKTIVDSDLEICLPPKLQLSSENIDRHGVYILDVCESIYMWIGRSVNDQFLQQVFNVKSFNELPAHGNELPELDNALSERIRNFIVYLYDQRPFGASFVFFREDSHKSYLFFQHIHEDKTESSVSYNEFIRYLNDQVKQN